jgi:hypothetical protein
VHFWEQVVKVEVKAEAKVEVKSEVTEEDVAAWGTKQRRSITSAKTNDSSCSTEAVRPPDTKANSGETKVVSHKPGQAGGAARTKAHTRLAAVKKEKEQTLTALLTARSEVCVPFGFVDSWCFLRHQYIYHVLSR